MNVLSYSNGKSFYNLRLRALLLFPSKDTSIGSKRHGHTSREKRFCLANHEMDKSYWYRINNPSVES